MLNRYRCQCIYTPLLLLSLISVATAATPIPSPPKISAEGHLLVDFHSGRVLAEENADNRLEPASLTKIMTAYVVFRELAQGNIKLDEQVTVSKKAWRTPGSRMFIEVGKKVQVELLLKGLIVQSGNDASVALSEHLAGSEETFAELMNSHAQRLGMSDSHFVNSTGLPNKDHYTTPRDIAKVTAATIREFPEYYPWYAIKAFKFNDIEQKNRNRLLWRDAAFDGVKTGHTEAAGYCLVASAQKNNMRLISVVMGTSGEEERARDTQNLTNYGFRFFETHKLYSANQAVAETRVWKGASSTVRLGLAQDTYVTIPRGSYQNLDAKMRLETRVLAPIKKGKQLGQITITLDQDEVTRSPLVAVDHVDAGSWWQTLIDTTLLWFQ